MRSLRDFSPSAPSTRPPLPQPPLSKDSSTFSAQEQTQHPHTLQTSGSREGFRSEPAPYFSEPTISTSAKYQQLTSQIAPQQRFRITRHLRGPLRLPQALQREPQPALRYSRYQQTGGLRPQIGRASC